jgi:hypothetical protein
MEQEANMTLREWLEEAEAKGYPIADFSIAKRYSGQEIIGRTDSAHLESVVELIDLNELYRASGERGTIARTPDDRWWVRLEPLSE